MSDTFDTYIKLLYIDPLVSGGVITYTDKNHREKAVNGDYLLNSYICKLDEEIFSDPPLGVNKDAWNENNLSNLFTQVLDKARTHGYAVVQFYQGKPQWRVFSETDRNMWLYDDDKNVVGMQVSYGSETKENLYFGLNQCYLFKYKEGDNKGDKFAYGDLDEALWNIVTATRQIENQLNIMGAKPELYHVVYGNPSPSERAAVINALDDTNVMVAFAATESAVKEIRVVKHESYGDLMNLLEMKLKRFAGLTRLPLAFYNGERTSGSGTGGAAENVVELKIDRRKKHIFNKIKPFVTQILKEVYGIATQNIDLDSNQVEAIENGQKN